MVTRAEAAPFWGDSSSGTRKVASSPPPLGTGRDGAEGLDGAPATTVLPPEDEDLNIDPTAKPTTPPTMRAMMTEGFMGAGTPLGEIKARVL